MGAGGFGLVVSVRDKETGRKLALKIASYDTEKPSQSIKSLEREYEMLIGLDQTNIIKVY